MEKGGGSIEKIVGVSFEETGRQIGEKLLPLLTATQRKELILFIRELGDTYLKDSNIIRTTNDYSNYYLSEYFTEMRVGELYLCLEKRVVQVKGREIKLTVKEFNILALLIMHPKRVFTYEMLMDLVWHEDYTFYSRKAVNNHVSNLRKKLKITPDIPDYVKSVYGVGYKFEV